MHEKIERNKRMALDVLKGMSLKDVAKKYKVTDVRVEQVVTTTFRKYLPEQRLKYLPAIAIRKDGYKERLERVLQT